MGLITTANDQVWKPMLGYQPGDPAAIPESMLTGAAMGHAGALARNWKASGGFGDAGPASFPGLFRYKVPLPPFRPESITAYGGPEFDPAVAPIWDRLDAFSEGRAAFERNGHSGYLDKDGKVVIDLGIIYETMNPFTHGLAHVRKTNSHEGYLKRDGTWAFRRQLHPQGCLF